MDNKDVIRLRHMLDACHEAVLYKKTWPASSPEQKRLLLHGMVRSLEIIGEAAGKVSTGTRALLPELPWPEIIAMRNWLIHAYFDINEETVLQTVDADLPFVVEALSRFLSDLCTPPIL